MFNCKILQCLYITKTYKYVQFNILILHFGSVKTVVCSFLIELYVFEIGTFPLKLLKK